MDRSNGERFAGMRKPFFCNAPSGARF